MVWQVIKRLIQSRIMSDWSLILDDSWSDDENLINFTFLSCQHLSTQNPVAPEMIYAVGQSLPIALQAIELARVEVKGLMDVVPHPSCSPEEKATAVHWIHCSWCLTEQRLSSQLPRGNQPVVKIDKDRDKISGKVSEYTTESLVWNESVCGCD